MTKKDEQQTDTGRRSQRFVFVGLGIILLILGVIIFSNEPKTKGSNAGIGFLFMGVGLMLIVGLLFPSLDDGQLGKKKTWRRRDRNDSYDE